MNFDENDVNVLSYAENDNSAGHYAFKAATALKERVAKRIFPLEFINAWH